MKVRIHRGAHEIGGSCVEVESSSGDRLVLDVGAPLSTSDGVQPPLPAVGGLVSDDPALLGIVLSHAHQDHWGLVDQALPSVPLFMGEATHRILAETAFWTRGLSRVPDGFLEHRRSFALGPFEITPFLNDHSAYDAYSLLVEADGRRIFYTGDIRGHGRKRGIFEQLLRRPPEDIDVLLMEGTNVSPGEQVDVEPIQSEERVEEACADVFRDAAGMVLAIYSAQNIDRMVTLFRATKRADRTFVLTLYGASIALATGEVSSPDPPKPRDLFGWAVVYAPAARGYIARDDRGRQNTASAPSEIGPWPWHASGATSKVPMAAATTICRRPSSIPCGVRWCRRWSPRRCWKR